MQLFPTLTVAQAKLLTQDQFLRLVSDSGFSAEPFQTRFLNLRTRTQETFEMSYGKSKSLVLMTDCSFSESDYLYWTVFSDVNAPIPMVLFKNYRRAIAALTSLLGPEKVMDRNKGDLCPFDVSLGCSRYPYAHPEFFFRLRMEVTLLLMLVTKAFLCHEPLQLPDDWRSWCDESLD